MSTFGALARRVFSMMVAGPRIWWGAPLSRRFCLVGEMTEIQVFKCSENDQGLDTTAVLECWHVGFDLVNAFAAPEP